MRILLKRDMTFWHWHLLQVLRIRKLHGLMNNQSIFLKIRGILMKNTFKKLFISFTVLSLTACGSTTMQDNTFAAKENKDFTKYTNQLVVEYAENDYTTMHQFFEHPEDYGIDINNVDVSLGEFYTDNTEEIKEDQKELNKFNRNTLDKTQQTIYDELKYENELSLKAENKKFQYLNNCWSTMSGLHQSLISVFSEYILRSEKDIQDLITLINDVPRYTNDVLEYTKNKQIRIRYSLTMILLFKIFKMSSIIKRIVQSQVHYIMRLTL